MQTNKLCVHTLAQALGIPPDRRRLETGLGAGGGVQGAELVTLSGGWGSAVGRGCAGGPSALTNCAGVGVLIPIRRPDPCPLLPVLQTLSW